MANLARPLVDLGQIPNMPYQGAPSPFLMVTDRIPTTSDAAGGYIGAMWQLYKTDTVAPRIFTLVRIQIGPPNIYTWLELTTGGGVAANMFITDNGTVIPAAGIVTIKGGPSANNIFTNINTYANPNDSNHLVVALNDSIFQPNTTADSSEGMYSLNGDTFMHNYGTRNTWLGTNAGNLTLTVGSAVDNTGLGYTALHAVTSGARNFAGGFALGALTTSSDCIGIGYNSLNSVQTTAGGSIGIGTNALTNYTGSVTGESSIAIGYNALGSAVDQVRMVAIGEQAMESGQGNNSIAIGFQAAQNMGLSTSCIFIGYQAGQNNNAGGVENLGVRNIGIGTLAMSTGVATGGSNICLGYSSGLNISSGEQNFLGGENSGFSLTSGSNNCSIGFNSLQNATLGSENCAYGYLALNAYIGDGNDDNIAIGARSLTTVQHCNDNIAIGADSLGSNASAVGDGRGSSNVAIGDRSLFTLNPAGATDARYNISLGTQSGFNLITGSENCFLGRLAGSAYTGAETGNVCLGYNVTGTVSESHTTRIGVQGTQTAAYIAGIFEETVDADTGTAVFVDSDGLLGTIVSSERFKENIRYMGDDSIDIMDLRPVRFSYKKDATQRMHYGLIAEEVKRVFPDLVTYDAEGNPLSVKYHDLPVLLLNELQKLRERVQRLESQ